MKSRRRELAPCGVFCGACPSYNKTCLGCASERKDQKRTSKWGCKIRKCCYDTSKIPYCIECDQFPCEKLKKKLIDSHRGDHRFRYRHEIPEVFVKMRELGVEEYHEYQKKRWTCPDCGGRILFYHYECSKCGKNMTV